MTDNEIVKALEICDMGSCCDECAYRNYSRCNEMLAHDALGIIHRQNAEIEELRKYKHDYYVLKAEVIKEFERRVLKLSEYGSINISLWQLHKVAEEMMEEVKHD